MGEPRRAYFRPVGEKTATKYFVLPSGMVDLFGVVKSEKKDVGFLVLRKSPGIFHYAPYTFDFLEVSFNSAKSVENNPPGKR